MTPFLSGFNSFPSLGKYISFRLIFLSICRSNPWFVCTYDFNSKLRTFCESLVASPRGLGSDMQICMSKETTIFERCMKPLPALCRFTDYGLYGLNLLLRGDPEPGWTMSRWLIGWRYLLHCSCWCINLRLQSTLMLTKHAHPNSSVNFTKECNWISSRYR